MSQCIIDSVKTNFDQLITCVMLVSHTNASKTTLKKQTFHSHAEACPTRLNITVGPVVSISRPHNSCSLPPSKSLHRATLSTPRNGFSGRQRWVLRVLVPQFLPNRVPICDLLPAGLVIVRVASFFGVSYLPHRLGPAACTWMTDVAFLVALVKEALRKQIPEVQTWRQVRGPAGAVMCETRVLGIKHVDTVAHFDF